MANLKTNSILGAIALGKRNADKGKPAMLPEVKITSTKLVPGDPTYNFGGKVISHSAILNAVPASQRSSVDKYLTSFRIKQGGAERPVTGTTSAINDHYVLNSAGTKNDTYDMINSVAKGIK